MYTVGSRSLPTAHHSQSVPFTYGDTIRLGPVRVRLEGIDSPKPTPLLSALVLRADAIEGCFEGSDEEAELATRSRPTRRNTGLKVRCREGKGRPASQGACFGLLRGEHAPSP